MRSHSQRALTWTLLLVIVVGFVGPARAPIVVLSPYSQLMADSDLVIIGVPTATRETEETTRVPCYQGRAIASNDSAYHVYTKAGESRPVLAHVVETTFRVELCLKGHADVDSSVVLLHLKEVTPPDAVVGGLDLVEFKPEERQHYLLFLIHESGGRFAPTGGQDHPARNGIHLLEGARGR